MDFACGTGGFLTSALKLLDSRVKTPADKDPYSKSVYGIEKKQRDAEHITDRTARRHRWPRSPALPSSQGNRIHAPGHRGMRSCRRENP